MPDDGSSSRDSFPRITKDAWHSNRSTAFMTWMTTISVLIADTELKNYALTWTIITDPIRQKADSTFPVGPYPIPPLSVTPIVLARSDSFGSVKLPFVTT